MNNPARSALLGAATAILLMSVGSLLTPGGLHAADEQGQIRGILYEADGVTRLVSGLVVAANVKTGKRYQSILTGENGAFEILQLGAGTYDIIVAHNGGLYAVKDLVDLVRNQRLTISLSVGVD